MAAGGVQLDTRAFPLIPSLVYSQNRECTEGQNHMSQILSNTALLA